VAVYKAKQSMSRKGNCWDNAVAESFFATLKQEDIYGQALKLTTAVLAQVFGYIACDYNRVRRHSSNGWLSPVQFEHNDHQHSEIETV
jgi:putative transposase